LNIIHKGKEHTFVVTKEKKGEVNIKNGVHNKGSIQSPI